MIRTIRVHKDHVQAYNITRNIAIVGSDEGETQFPLIETLFKGGQELIEACDPYIELFDRITRVSNNQHVYILRQAGYEIEIMISGIGIARLWITFAPYILCQEDAEKIFAQVNHCTVERF